MERAALVDTVHGTVAAQCFYKLSVKDVLSGGIAKFAGVVENISHSIGDDSSGDTFGFCGQHGGGNIFRVQFLQTGKGGVDRSGSTLQCGMLGTKHEILTDQQGIGIHQNENNE